MLGQKCADEPRKNVLCDCRRNAKGKFPRQLTFTCGQFLLSFGDNGQNSLRVPQQKPSLSSQGHAAPGAIKHTDSEIVFQRFDLKCDRRLRQKKLFRGFSKTEVVGNGSKHL